ncbi:MAG: class I SAM-dependent methyltransferase, partial [Desulfobulbaceae bacterium]|nr:class I SAM-dependent methyltransferase [Desulfobulbaceae bacterium]
LGVAVGMDPAAAPLRLAEQRGVIPCQAIGEALPVADGRLGTIYLLFTLCFIQEPRQVLDECSRALQRGGHLVVGMIPAAGSWGKNLAAKREAGNPYYRHARFQEPATVAQWLEECGLAVTECRSTLFQEPEQLTGFEPSRPGLTETAGLVIMVARKR